MMQYKNTMVGEPLDIDEQRKTVKTVWARFNNTDLDGDIITPEAVSKTIRERGPLGSKLIWSLIDHRASLKTAIGKPTELYVEGDALIAITKILDTELGEDITKMYVDGLINQHSIGFQTIKSDMQREARVITELMLYEGSAVLWGANPETPTLGMKSLEGINNELTLTQRLEKLTKAVKHGVFTDETFGIFEIEIKQIQSLIDSKFTQPAPKAVEPNVELIEALTQFNNNFKNY